MTQAQDVQNCRVVSERGKVAANFGANAILKARNYAAFLNNVNRDREIQKGYREGYLTRYRAVCDIPEAPDA